jgi:hypothetical protein
MFKEHLNRGDTCDLIAQPLQQNGEYHLYIHGRVITEVDEHRAHTGDGTLFNLPQDGRTSQVRVFS